MRKKFALNPSPPPTQRVFRYENRLLASLEVSEATRIKRVWDQAYYHPFGSNMPMLPERVDANWRSTPPTKCADLLTTYQTNAVAMDMGIDRVDLAAFPNFRQFRYAARDGTRFFDQRVGPPWWSTDREFLEVAYTAAMHQEEPDEFLNESLSCYWGECADTPMWAAQSFFDAEHASSSNIVGGATMHCYGLDSSKPVLRAGWTQEAAKATILLNWQITEQPRLSLGECELEKEEAETLHQNTFPHRHELKRIVRALNAKPRGRPQRSLVCPR